MRFYIFLGLMFCLCLGFEAEPVFAKNEPTVEIISSSGGIEFIKDGEGFRVQLPEGIEIAVEERAGEKIGLMFLFFFLGSGFLGIGIVKILYPDKIYEIWEDWKSHSYSEPSDSYRKIKREEGVLEIIGAIIFYGIFLYICFH